MPDTRGGISRPARRPDVDGLRGLAVLLVVCFHAGVPWLRGAFVAVDVFFVLSGFFLMTALMRRLVADERISLGEVYARRVWRLLPALAVVLVVTLVTAMLLYAPIDRANVANNMRPVSVFAGNIAFAATGVNYFSGGVNPLLHTWTLGVEYQLALFLPAYVAALAAFGLRRAGTATGHERRVIVMQTVLIGILIAGAVSFAISAMISDSAPTWAYFGPHTRLWSFCAGAATACIAGGGQGVFSSSPSRTTVLQFVGLGAIVLSALFYDRSLPYPGAIALAPVGGAVLLLSAGEAGGATLLGRLLLIAPIAWLGRVSFAWYLWHYPLMKLGGVLAPDIGMWGHLAWGLAGLLLAVLTQWIVERPIHATVTPRILSGRPLLTAACVAVALVLVAQLAAWRSTSFVENSEHRAYAAAREDRMYHGCWD